MGRVLVFGGREGRREGPAIFFFAGGWASDRLIEPTSGLVARQTARGWKAVIIIICFVLCVWWAQNKENGFFWCCVAVTFSFFLSGFSLKNEVLL